MFEGRLPARLQAAAPKVVETEEGHEVWQFDGQDLLPGRPQRGRRAQDRGLEGRADTLRRDAARAVTTSTRASATWTSTACGRRSTSRRRSPASAARSSRVAADPELGLAVTQAWNDWFFDEWYSPHPDRMVPMGITYLADAGAGAREEIRRNAARGFTAVTLPEMPHRIGMEPIFSPWWDPIIAACAETDTVDLPARRVDRRRRHAEGRADGAARRDAVRPALAEPRARSGCGRATR